MRADLYAFLAADPGITAIIGDRIYPVKLPNGAAYPALTWQFIVTVNVSTLSSPGTINRARVQFDSWGKTYADAVRLSEAVRALLDGYRGDAAEAIIAGAHVQGGGDTWEEGAQVYRVSHDYELTYYPAEDENDV